MTDIESNELGIPTDALRRLAEMKPGQRTSLFTSDLSVNEFLLVREAGFRPLGLVLGSSIYHVGFQMGRWSQNQELGTLSQAMYHARELAMTRMEAEADVLGADGIVGVRLDIEFKEFGSDLAEFIAVGTAVKADEAHRLPRLQELGLAHCVFWGADYPHYDCTYPGAARELDEHLAPLPRDLADGIRHRNAARFLGSRGASDR